MNKKRTKTKFKKRDFISWLVMLPTLVLFGFYIWEPLIENIRLSLYKTKGFKVLEFAGLANYKRVLQLADFQAAFKNTFSYTLWSLVIGFFIPMIIAVLISETVHLKSFFRVSVYFPNIVPGLATVWIASYFFTPGKTGVLNILLGRIGLGPFNWLNDKAWTIPLIIIILTWKAAGSTALIYMANISGISSELYEAATIDGATIWQRIRHITIPSINGLARTLLILQIISVFQILYEPMVLKNGGPNNASISLMMLVYRQAFDLSDFSAAAALSVMICLILIVLSGLYSTLVKKQEN